MGKGLSPRRWHSLSEFRGEGQAGTTIEIFAFGVLLDKSNYKLTIDQPMMVNDSIIYRLSKILAKRSRL